MGWVVNLKIFNPHNLIQPTYEQLIEHLTEYCDENPIDYLNDTKYLENIESEIKNYVNSYAIYDDTDFN